MHRRVNAMDGTSSSDEHPGPLARVRRVLVVDADADSRLHTLLSLRMLGLPAVPTTTGDAALEALATDDYDLVLVDIALPDMRGTDLVRALREMPRNRSVRVLAHASYVLPGDVDRSFDAGCDAFIEHPFPPGALERAIAALFT